VNGPQKSNWTTPSQLTRRGFLRAATLATGAARVGFPQVLLGQNAGAKLNVAVVGAGGQGTYDADEVARLGEHIVALCDADERQARGQCVKYPKAKFYRDFRKMFDEMGNAIDAVIVSTPDHLHAAAALRAMKLGKHVYVQKPLAHSVWEARELHQVARQKQVATQMGNQGSAENGLRRAIEVIQAGVIGQVRYVHVWSNRPLWPQGMDRPAEADPVPEGLDWDLWIGPAPMRPFKLGVYHPFNWRAWQDFGTGALGDMAAQTANLPFRALKLGYATEIEAESSLMNKETYPWKSKIRFEFPARENLAPLTFWWYDGGEPVDNNRRHDGSNKPPKEVTADIEKLPDKVPGSGCLLIGDKGKLFSPGDFGAEFLVKLSDDKELKAGQKHDAVMAIPEKFDRSPGHYREWINACKGSKPAYSNFELAAPFTEAMLLGCVALRTGKKLEWDTAGLKATNAPEAAPYLKREYRPGWEV
jgi:hypothetical protein